MIASLDTSAMTRRLAPDPLRQALSAVPAGEHALVEAALAWRDFQPPNSRPPRQARVGAQAPGNRPPYVPLIEAPDEAAAGRLCRLLSELSWAVTMPADHRGVLRVKVPASGHALVLRALGGALRNTRRELAANPMAAAALWRMGLLIGGHRAGRDAIHLRIRSTATAELLAEAATTLGADATIEHLHTGPAVLVCQGADVRRLLNAALCEVGCAR